MSNNTFVPNSARPLRRENLRPGSYFTIFAEPSRGIRRSTDSRIYRSSTDGFYALNVENGEACVLYPNDLVLPMRRK